jgi:hypothetical protein
MKTTHTAMGLAEAYKPTQIKAEVLYYFKKKVQFHVCGSVHHSKIQKEKSNKMQQCVKIFIIPYLYESQHISGDTPPIIMSLKLH